jgi:hypothetical protein
MKENSWDECIESNNSITITPNKQKALSLKETAEGEYPKLCQEVYRTLKEELTAINTDIEAMLEKEKSKTEAEKRAAMSLKERVVGAFQKNDDEIEEPD